MNDTNRNESAEAPTRDQLLDRFGSAKHPERNSARSRPSGAGEDDATVSALGKLSAALEVVETARGHLYEFHRMSGSADLTLQEAVGELRDAGHDELATTIEQVLVGRDVIPDHWTFQIVDEYDDQYYSVFTALEAYARQQAGGYERHVFEAEMKLSEQDGPQQ